MHEPKVSCLAAALPNGLAGLKVGGGAALSGVVGATDAVAGVTALFGFGVAAGA